MKASKVQYDRLVAEFLSSGRSTAALAAFSAARDNPQALRHNVADFSDGACGVRLGNSFYGVDNDMPVRGNAMTPAIGVSPLHKAVTT